MSSNLVLAPTKLSCILSDKHKLATTKHCKFFNLLATTMKVEDKLIQAQRSIG